jgi:hypothetical protein
MTSFGWDILHCIPSIPSVSALGHLHLHCNGTSHCPHQTQLEFRRLLHLLPPSILADIFLSRFFFFSPPLLHSDFSYLDGSYVLNSLSNLRVLDYYPLSGSSHPSSSSGAVLLSLRPGGHLTANRDILPCMRRLCGHPISCIIPLVSPPKEKELSSLNTRDCDIGDHHSSS